MTSRPRWLLFVGIVSIALVAMAGYNILSATSKHVAAPSVQAVQKRFSLPKDVALSWPAVGQAAVGSVEDGLLTRSSEHETQSPTASMAKVITALAILEKRPLQSGQTGPTYTITASDVADYQAYAAQNGSVVAIYEGMTLTQYQALQLMLIPSANNIAELLVKRVFGSEDAYTNYAQAMVKRMGLRHTIVTDASGFSSATVSTPSELVTIGIAALKNSVIADIVAQPEATIPGVGLVKNTNELLGTDGVIGIKTGTTNLAGNCLLFAARYVDSHNSTVTLVAVIMGDTNAAELFGDSRILLSSAQQAYMLAPPTARSTDKTLSH